MGGPRVIVCGSLHYDIAVETRNWPQTGETAVGSAWHPKLGGKGRNQAVAAARAGAETVMIGRVGDDEFGRDLRADLARRGIAHDRVAVSGVAGSGMSVALFDPGGDYRAVIVSGANLELGPADIPGTSFWQPGDVLVLQNEIPEAANLAMAGAARAAGVTVILNAAPARALPPALRAATALLVVNAIEAAALGGIAEPTTLPAAAAAAARLAAGGPGIIVTAGGAGLAYAGPGGALELTAEPVRVVNTHGAGDEFVGHFAARLAAGMDLPAALAAANHAAAMLISTPEALRS